MTDEIAVVLFFLSNLTDIWTTNLVLKKGGREMNPFVRMFMRSFGDNWWITKMMVAAIIAVVVAMNGSLTMLAWLSIPFFAVSAWNYNVWRKMK